jgi:hypothetical protein
VGAVLALLLASLVGSLLAVDSLLLVVDSLVAVDSLFPDDSLVAGLSLLLLSSLPTVALLALRLSVIYQPEPLKTMPTG